MLRYDETTGAFLGAFAMVLPNDRPLNMTIGADGNLYGNLYVTTGWVGNSVRRFDGSTGQIIDELVAHSSGGLTYATGLLFISHSSTQIPTTAVAGGPYTGRVGESIEFDGSGSFGDRDIILYEWDFEGDGIFDSHSSTSVATHTYAADFSGVVTLRVTDNDGVAATDTALILIAQPVLTNASLLLVDIGYGPYDPTPVANAPAGVYHIRGTFRTYVALGAVFFKVVTITGNNVVLNAEGRAGGPGATVSVNGVSYSCQDFAVDFEVGLQSRESFRFFVDAYGTRLPRGGSGSSGSSEAEGNSSYQFDVPGEQLRTEVHTFYVPAMAR